MQKGVQLEYKMYWPKPDSSNNMTGVAVARLLFEVEKVTDSAGSTYSTISKKGFGVHNENDLYERKLVLKCDGMNLFIPFDFYLSDTFYANDMWPHLNLGNYGWSYGCKPLDDAITYIVPLVMDCIVGLPEGQKEVVQIAKVGYEPFSTFKKVNYIDRTYKIISIKLAGKEWLTTPAGEFYCYKFCLEHTMDNDPEPRESWLYFNSVTGLVKFEEYRRRIELIGITK
jgi:hypothetical protein